MLWNYFIPSHRIPSHRIVSPGLLSVWYIAVQLCFVVVCLSLVCVFVSVIVVIMSSVHMSTGVSIERLDGTNYHVWKFKMQLILEDKELFGVIDGSDAKPERADAVADWVKRDKKARVTICLALTDSVLATVRSCETAVSVWEKLASVFESKSLVNRLFTRRKLLTMKMSEGDALSTHINTLKTLAEQLAAIGAQISEEDLVMTLLMSLPASYEHFITALESVSENELTYDYVVAKLLNFDLRKKENGAPSSGESALVMQQKSDPTKLTCFYCKEPGHFKRDCPKLFAKTKRFERANNVKDESSEVVFMASDGADHHCWYIDSGATQHMSGDRAAFVEYAAIPPKAVYMGDNNKQDAVGQGSVKMVLDVSGSALKAKFTNVLFVPNLKSNLISVSRLIKDGFSVQFGAAGCDILKNGVVVAQGVSENRLYRLNGRIVYYEKACLVNVSAGSAAELWHKRLGHLSESGLNTLVSVELPAPPEKVNTPSEVSGKALLLQHPPLLQTTHKRSTPSLNRPLYMGDNNKQDAVGQGSVKMVLQVSGSAVKAKFTNVLYVPNLKSNLISVSRLIKDGFSVQFTAAGCDISKNGVVVAQGVSENRLYRLSGRIVYYDKACLVNASADGSTAELWHKRLGHLVRLSRVAT